MGLRGPKPVESRILEVEATNWAQFFYTLRDGQPGYLQRVKWGPWQTTSSAMWTPVPSGKGTVMVPSKTRYRTSQALGRPIPIPVADGAKELPAGLLKAKDWVVSRPVMPKAEVWQQLEKARTLPQVKHAAEKIGELGQVFASTTSWAQNPGGALTEYAGEVLKAKRLPHYPRTSRQRSEDKRIIFWAKVMAGATLGLAPITAVKRLAHWHFPKDWAESTLEDSKEKSGEGYGPPEVLRSGDVSARAGLKDQGGEK